MNPCRRYQAISRQCVVSLSHDYPETAMQAGSAKPVLVCYVVAQEDRYRIGECALLHESAHGIAFVGTFVHDFNNAFSVFYRHPVNIGDFLRKGAGLVLTGRCSTIMQRRAVAFRLVFKPIGLGSICEKSRLHFFWKCGGRRADPLSVSPEQLGAMRAGDSDIADAEMGRDILDRTPADERQPAFEAPSQSLETGRHPAGNDDRLRRRRDVDQRSVEIEKQRNGPISTQVTERRGRAEYGAF